MSRILRDGTIHHRSLPRLIYHDATPPILKYLTALNDRIAFPADLDASGLIGRDATLLDPTSPALPDKEPFLAPIVDLTMMNGRVPAVHDLDTDQPVLENLAIHQPPLCLVLEEDTLACTVMDSTASKGGGSHRATDAHTQIRLGGDITANELGLPCQ